MEGSASQAGFYYQNNVAALKIIDCLFFNTDITHIRLENYDKGHHKGKNFLYSSFQTNLLRELYENEDSETEIQDDLYADLISKDLGNYNTDEEGAVHRRYNINTNFDTIEIQSPYYNETKESINRIFNTKIKQGCFEDGFVDEIKSRFRIYDPSKLLYKIKQRPNYINWLPKDISESDFIGFNDFDDLVKQFTERESDYLTLVEIGNQRPDKLCRKLYGDSNFSAYSNLKKRLYSEVLDALSIDIVQVENQTSFFEMRVAATSHLRNAYMLWQQKLHQLALSEFQIALKYALQSLDVYMLAHIRHQIIVLSSFNVETLPDITLHHKEINQYFEHIPFLNDLCLLYYKVRYAEHFASTEIEIKRLYLEALATHQQMELQVKNKEVQLLVLNGLIHCYEKLEMKDELSKTIKRYLDTSKPLVKSATKDFIAKRKMLEAKYQELSKNFIRENKILKDKDLMEFSSNNQNSVLSKLRLRKQFRAKVKLM